MDDCHLREWVSMLTVPNIKDSSGPGGGGALGHLPPEALIIIINGMKKHTKYYSPQIRRLFPQMLEIAK